MTFLVNDTIAAIASAPGGAARGIVRLSGPRAVACVAKCFTPAERNFNFESRTAHAMVGALCLVTPGVRLPGELYLWPTERSYTRQPAAEFHTIGSPPLLEAALEAVCAAGARLAEPGEFTLRAFLAGRLDLTQVEAVLGVIDAQSHRELDIALTQLSGGLAGPLSGIRDQLLDLLAHLEAGLDFVDEEIEFISAAELESQLRDAAEAVRRTAKQMRARGETPDAWRVALVGWPNVGKSSLLNALANETAALVSETAGTTRDYVRRRVAWEGFALELIDTAGVETTTSDAIAAAAQAMTSEQAAQAHLTLHCLDASRPLNAWEEEQLAPLRRASNALALNSHPPSHHPSPPALRLLVVTKADRPRLLDLELPHVTVSSATGEGMELLRRRIQATISEAYEEANVVAGTAARCRESLRLAAECLERASEAATSRRGEELVASEVRAALEELGKVAGQVYTDDVLDRIFSRFCIGK